MSVLRNFQFLRSHYKTIPGKKIQSLRLISGNLDINDHIFGLNDDQIKLRNTIHNFCQKELAPKAADIDKNDHFADLRTFWRKLGDLGALGMTAEPEYGGTGSGFLDHIVVIEELSRASASIGLSYGAHSNLCVNQITRHGTVERKQKYLPKLCSGEHIGALAMSEADAGSDVVSMKLTAEKDSSGNYILNGGKFWITNGSDADVLVVYARTNPSSKNPQHGLSAFIVEKTFPGFSVGKKLDKLGMRGSSTAELIFENCVVPKENLLGPENKGVYVLMTGLDYERLVLSGIGVGLMQACCDVAFEYCHTRKQFGKPIGSFQLMQGKMADMYTKLAASRCYLYSVGRAADQGRVTNIDCAGPQLFGAERAVEIALEAVQCLGGNGYTNDYPTGRFLRDAKLLTIGGGTSEIRRLVVGRAINAAYSS